MLGGVHLGGQRLQRVARLHRHLRLLDNLPGIDLERDVMHRATRGFYAGPKCLADAIKPGKTQTSSRLASRLLIFPANAVEALRFKTRA